MMSSEDNAMMGDSNLHDAAIITPTKKIIRGSRRTQYTISVCCFNKFNQGIFFEALRQKRSRERPASLARYSCQILKFACDKSTERGARAHDYKNTLQWIDRRCISKLDVSRAEASERERALGWSLCAARGSALISNCLVGFTSGAGKLAATHFSSFSPIVRKTNNASTGDFARLCLCWWGKGSLSFWGDALLCVISLW
jgi:hypothetical protein